MSHLAVVSPLVALPSCLPQLVVASPLVAPPLFLMRLLLPLDKTAAASQCASASPHANALTSHSPLVTKTPPAPGRLFFWMPGASGLVDKDGSTVIRFWLVGELLATPLLLPAEI
jgi:hypothetical protein